MNDNGWMSVDGKGWTDGTKWADVDDRQKEQ
jgi:hypothetical protein